MTLSELTFGIFIGIIFLMLIIFIITEIVTKINSKKINNIRTVYIEKLSNSDFSIQNAMKYLKLTNGIMQQLNGDKK